MVKRKPKPKAIDNVQVDLKAVEQMAAQGLTMEQIINCLPVGQTKFYELRKENPKLAEAINRGRAKGINLVSNALFNKAYAENDFNAQKYYLQCRGGSEWNPANKMDVTNPIQFIFNRDFGVENGK